MLKNLTQPTQTQTLILTNISKVTTTQKTSPIQVDETREKSRWTELSKKHTLRDFNRYVCKDVRRIGGMRKFIDAAQDQLYRIDGAWYVCFDELLKPRTNWCLVCSFGINVDESFDFEMYRKYGCNVYSFDPNVEAKRFEEIRKADAKLNESFEIKVNDKWRFYRIGIQGAPINSKIPQDLKISSMLNFDEILELTGNRNKVVDIFKMDIESNEKSVLESIDIDYFCKYVKQFKLEVHPLLRQDARKLLTMLEKCFNLYHRDTRFYMHDGTGETGHLTEFQSKNSVKIELTSFQNEIEMADFMFSMGELYFVNLNFLDQS